MRFLYTFLEGWVILVTGLVCVVSFGAYRPNWSDSYHRWFANSGVNDINATNSHSETVQDQIIDDMYLSYRARGSHGKKSDY
jgi:hypothetical protein